MSGRQVIKLKKDWLSSVEPGVPFSLVEDAEIISETKRPPKTPVQPKRRTSKGPRSLKQLGELYTVQEVAAMLKVSADTVYSWIYESKLRKTPVGRHVRIASSDLEDFLCA
jgi:excisionase family DNA binding protein